MLEDFIMKNDDQQNLHNENVENYQTNASESEKTDILPCPENILQPLIYLDEDTLKLNKHIEERIRNLQKTMLSLKSALTEEKEAWSREIEEMTQLYKHNECECESYISPCIKDSDIDINYYPELTVSESVMDYEQKLSMYQRTLKVAQYEKRYQLRRQLAASAYKRRLLEVENMCNLELLRVKQSVQFLQPLQKLASEWDFRHSGESGDGNMKFSLDDNTSNFSSSISQSNFQEKINTFTNDTPPIECIGSIIYDEMAKLAMVINKPVNFSSKIKEMLIKPEETASTIEQHQSAVCGNNSNNASSTSTVGSLP